MTITIKLTAEEEERLVRRAASHGQDIHTYVHQLIERDLLDDVDRALRPFRRQVEDSGVTDEELRSFFEEVRDDVWRDRQPGAGGVP
ncbi:MAG: hypothetical protein U0835_13775 [Isosphaeraceae bacterium]